MIGQLDSSKFPTLYEMKRHVFALGKLAGIPVSQCRAAENEMWFSSPQRAGVTPQQGEGGSTALPVQS
eukprot:7723588-Karenia_brevis.AAC.1